MSMFTVRQGGIALAALWAGAPTRASAAPTAAAHYAAGKKIIEANCGDSYRPSREALEKGIAEMGEAVRLGLEDAGAHRLLACAYNTIRFEFAAVGRERVAIAQKELAAVRRAADLDPRDVASRLHVAELTKDEAEKARAYEAVLAFDPDHAIALFASGQLLIRSGMEKDGLARLERAGEVARPKDAAAIGGEIVRVLREHGKESRADELKRKLDEKARSAHD